MAPVPLLRSSGRLKVVLMPFTEMVYVPSSISTILSGRANRKVRPTLSGGQDACMLAWMLISILKSSLELRTSAIWEHRLGQVPLTTTSTGRGEPIPVATSTF